MKPKELYYVEVIPGGTPLAFREKGGGTYASKPYAVAQCDKLIEAGHIAVLFVTTADWHEVVE